MSTNDDIVTRLRAWVEWDEGKRSTTPIKNPFTDSWNKVSLEAADEIERLRSLIVKFVDAEREYQCDYQNAYNSPDDSASVLIKEEWRDSWTALQAESDSIKEVRGE